MRGSIPGLIRVYPAKFGGVGHILDQATGRLLCGGGFGYSVDMTDPSSGDNCKRCLVSLAVRDRRGVRQIRLRMMGGRT